MTQRQAIENVWWTESVQDLMSGYQNRIRLQFLGPGHLPSQSFHALKQIHSKLVVESSEATLSGKGGSQVEADGLFTRSGGETLCIKTADCLPLVLWSDESPFLSVLHAGWRGLFGGILEEAIKIYLSAGGRAESLHLITGPCISMAKFEVGPELLLSLSQTGLSLSDQNLALEKGVGDRWHIDLAMVAVLLAMQSGLDSKKLSVLRSCTYTKETWNSYRRTGCASPSNLTLAALH